MKGREEWLIRKEVSFFGGLVEVMVVPFCDES
jgi:hypothetical protein